MENPEDAAPEDEPLTDQEQQEEWQAYVNFITRQRGGRISDTAITGAITFF